MSYKDSERSLYRAMALIFVLGIEGGVAIDSGGTWLLLALGLAITAAVFALLVTRAATAFARWRYAAGRSDQAREFADLLKHDRRAA